MSSRLSCLSLVDPVPHAVLLLPLAVDAGGDAAGRRRRSSRRSDRRAGARHGRARRRAAGRPRLGGGPASGRGSRPARPARPARSSRMSPRAARDRRRPRSALLAACASIAGDASSPMHVPSGLARDRDRDAPVADRELDERPLRLPGELDVELNVVGHVRRPVVVDRREGVVEAHEADGIVARWTPRRSRMRRGPRSRAPPTRTPSRSSAFATSGARAHSSSRCAKYVTARPGWR